MKPPIETNSASLRIELAPQISGSGNAFARAAFRD
jgi:hypothetical protein